jgi:hypothetical protein
VRFILFIVAFFVATAAIGQEIITHGFVDCSACPTTVTQVHLCTGWRQPTEGTSDYFNACHTGLLVGVPKNYFGYQNHNNKAYVGLYTYFKGTANYKEYIGTKIKPLDDDSNKKRRSKIATRHR